MLLRGGFLQPLYGFGAEKEKPAAFPGETGRFLSVLVSFRGNFPHKKQIATAPVCRGSFVWICLSIAGLPITVCEDHVIQIARDELIQHRTYHTPFSFPIFYIIVYASRRGFARRKLYGFHNYFSHLLSILHSAYCVLGKDSL